MTAQHRDFSEPNCSGRCLEAIASLGKERAPDLQGPVTCAGAGSPVGLMPTLIWGKAKDFLQNILVFHIIEETQFPHLIYLF